MFLATHVVGMGSGGKDGPEIPAVSGDYRIRELWVVPVRARTSAVHRC